MILKQIRKTLTVPTSATTTVGTVGTIRGRVHKIEVLNSATSCGWWIYTDASVLPGGNIIDENLLGATGAGHVDTAGAVYYPVVANVLTTGTITDPDTTTAPIVLGSVLYNVDDCAQTEVLTIVIWYEPLDEVF